MISQKDISVEVIERPEGRKEVRATLWLTSGMFLSPEVPQDEIENIKARLRKEIIYKLYGGPMKRMMKAKHLCLSCASISSSYDDIDRAFESIFADDTEEVNA